MAVTWIAVFALLYYMKKVIVRIPKLDISGRWILITGCDSGFGNLMAKSFDARGCRVIAACYSIKGADELRAECSDRLITIQLDVSNDRSVADAFRQVQTHTNSLWALINNAGIQRNGLIDFSDMDDYTAVMNVNFFGGARMCKLFWPMVSAGSGRIINITSMLGRVALPGTSAYCASKFAFEAFTDCLRNELAPHNVPVILVEPGFFATPLLSTVQEEQRRRLDGLPQDVRKRWGEPFLAHLAKASGRVLKIGKPPQQVVDAVTHAVSAQRPKTRYMVGLDSWCLARLLSVLPTQVGDWAIRMIARHPPVTGVPKQIHADSMPLYSYQDIKPRL
eukprot:TRINITY_DN8442_c0_g1_i1.p1 TRINITY_DN8442_c0_g1~~TRINITY_DN8442_c0_g1_i1.p1  ORF type:complete len:335 (+),score=28.00 TRINITY_DN8442_c0_g1_i1:42-1046(+)